MPPEALRNSQPLRAGMEALILTVRLIIYVVFQTNMLPLHDTAFRSVRNGIFLVNVVQNLYPVHRNLRCPRIINLFFYIYLLITCKHPTKPKRLLVLERRIDYSYFVLNFLCQGKICGFLDTNIFYCVPKLKF